MLSDEVKFIRSYYIQGRLIFQWLLDVNRKKIGENRFAQGDDFSIAWTFCGDEVTTRSEQLLYHGKLYGLSFKSTCGGSALEVGYMINGERIGVWNITDENGKSAH